MNKKPNILAHNLSIARSNSKITQQQLADKIGIPRYRIGSYEEGRCEPNLEVFFKICNILGITQYESFISIRINKKTTPKSG